MRAIVLLILLIQSGPLWARIEPCAVSLSAVIAEGAKQDQIRFEIPEPVLEAIVEDAPMDFAKLRDCVDHVLVFREQWPVRGLENVGYKVQISSDSETERMTVEHVQPSTYLDERHYFGRLAECEGAKLEMIKLPHAIFGAASTMVPPEVKTKLRVKHRVTVDEVRQAFQNQDTELELSDAINPKYRSDPRFVFYGHTDAGRLLKVAVALKPGQRQFLLLSAY